MHLFQRLFHKSKHGENTTKDCSIYRILAPSVLAVCICAFCLCGTSWAWFTTSAITGTTSIQTPTYALAYQIGEEGEATELGSEAKITVPENGSYRITLSAAGTAGATGYCSVKIGDSEAPDYTAQITTGAEGTAVFTFTVNATADTEITLTPAWGTYSGTATIQNNGVITAPGFQPDNGQTPGDDTNFTLTTGPADPSTQDGAPAESAAPTPEPSATTAPTPTQPESTADTAEPTPAPKTATPESAATPPPETTE